MAMLNNQMVMGFKQQLMGLLNQQLCIRDY